jgi:hypothetical protein
LSAATVASCIDLTALFWMPIEARSAALAPCSAARLANAWSRAAAASHQPVPAPAFVCYLAGALAGHGDKELGAAVFAIVQPPESAAAGAA